MEEVKRSNKKQNLLLVLGLIAFIGLVGGVTYAFFNYTRTGAGNTIRVGRIAFISRQTETINLSNLFPIDPTETGIMDDEEKVGTLEIEIEGDTDYVDGVEYLISTVNSSITSNGKTLPISLDVTVTNLGTSSDSYFTARNSKNATIYKKLVGDTLTGDEQVLVGYIKPNTTSGTKEGVNGKITIKAYLDKNKILISDTYNDGEKPTDNMGTPASLGEGKTVFTTTEWNALQQNGVSFQIKVEANEGIWVEEPAQGTIESCPNCKFIYTTDILWTTWNNQSQTPTVLTSGYSTNYNDIVTTSGKNYFLGVVTNASNQITNVYACGIYNGTTPFCIEGTADGANYSSNSSFINGANLWNNTCSVKSNYTECGSCDESSVSAYANSHGDVYTGVSYDYRCLVPSDDVVRCYDGDGGK